MPKECVISSISDFKYWILDRWQRSRGASARAACRPIYLLKKTEYLKTKIRIFSRVIVHYFWTTTGQKSKM